MTGKPTIKELEDRIQLLEAEIERCRQTETVLQKFADRFHAIFQTSPNSININRLWDGLFIDANRSFTTLTGYAREDVIGKTSLEINLWNNPQDREKLVEGLRKNGIVKNMEAPFRLKNGSVRTGLTSASIITINNEPHILSVTRDIEDMKIIQCTLKENEEKYRLLLEHAIDAIFIAQDETIPFSNRRTRELTEYTAEELAAMPFINLVHPEDRAMVLENYQRRLAGEKFESTYTFRVISKTGVERWGQINATLTTWNSRPATLNVIRDITIQKKLEEELLQNQKMDAIGTLAGGIAHDFNNLLMGIQGYTSLMLLQAKSDSPHYAHLKGIEKIVATASDLTQQLLGFARKGKYEIVPSDLNELVQKSIALFSRTRKQIEISSELLEGLWTADVDPGQIERVLLNLYLNASQAMSDKGKIFVKTENIILDDTASKTYGTAPGKYVCLTIKDTGSGMDLKTRQRIFEPFFTTQKLGRGTGLGLPSAYGIIKNHDGFITVESEIGKGSSFHVFIPASSLQAKPVEPKGKAPAKESGVILLVDDEKMILEVSQLMLEKLGFSVLSAANGNDALEIYRREKDRVKLVILDMIMPNLNGYETYKLLKSINPDIKVLLSSGYSMDEQARKILEEGCSGFIQKPFNLKLLSKKINEILCA